MVEGRGTTQLTMGIDWLLLSSSILGRFLSGLSSRIFIISLPSMAKGLETDILGISWALISFQLSVISLSIVFGRVGDMYGRRKLFTLGFIIMTVSSFLCGISQNVFQLIIFRALQGVGGAMVESVTRALALDSMPEGAEGKASSIMTASYHTGFFIGPAIGGFIIDYLHWRGVFFALVPIGLAGIVLSAMKSEGGSSAAKPLRLSIDYLGAALLVILTLMIVLLLDRKAAQAVGLGEKGWLALAFAGVLWGFLAHENRISSPIMNLSLFRIRMFSFSSISLLTLSTARGLVSFVIPFYLQEILQISPSYMGMIFLAPPILSIASAPLAGYLTDRIGPRVPASIGVLFDLVSALIGISLRIDSHWFLPTLLLGLNGAATGFFNSANQAAIIGSVPKEHRGFASGIVRVGFDLGHMLGVSLGGLLLTLAFEYFSGISGQVASAKNPLAFVSSMNVSFWGVAALSGVAMMISLTRGTGTIRKPASRA